MALTNPKNVVTEERLNEYHQTILPYLGGNSMVACGGGYAPIGTVIAYMGTRAPSDFLICDGTVYNIADYTELADFFEAQFGSNNFFGGDGNTTFAVPDLRGEFLRGTGTNSHSGQGNGGAVGEHQDATEIPRIKETSTGLYGFYVSGEEADYKNIDSVISIATNINNHSATASGTSIDESATFTSRPTNTSVLYCIKAKSQGNGYSLDEQIVGTWIDGKPIYQKSTQVTLPAITDGTWRQVDWNIASLNVNEVISLKCLARQSAGQWTDGFYMSNAGYILKALYINNGHNDNYISVMSNSASYSNGKCYITFQYTKTTDV